MKSLLLLLSLAMIGGSLTPPVETNNAINSNTIYVDATNAKFNLIVNKHDNARTGADVDFVGSDSSINILGELPDFGDYRVDGNYRSIISFDAPQMKTIDRLTLRIKHNMYRQWDYAQWFPETFVDSYVIKAGGLYTPYGSQWMTNVTGVNSINTISCPNIGVPQDLIDLEARLGGLSAVTSGIYQGIWQSDYKYLIDAGYGNTKSISNSDIASRSFYVVLPMSYTAVETWISVAGTDQNDLPVIDGLDFNGDATRTTLDGFDYKYVDFGIDTPRSLYFTHRATIKSIDVISATVDATRLLSFGDYNFADNIFTLKLKDFALADDSASYEDESLVVLPGYDAVLFQASGATCSLRIIYDSDGVAVYQNIVDENGVENPITEDPYGNTDFNIGDWFSDLPDLGPLLELLTQILKIVLVVGGIGLFVWFIVLIARSSSKPSKSSNTKYRKK